MTAEEIRDLSVLIVGDLVINGLVKDCTDTDDEIEFEFQDAIAETLHKRFNFNKINKFEAYLNTLDCNTIGKMYELIFGNDLKHYADMECGQMIEEIIYEINN